MGFFIPTWLSLPNGAALLHMNGVLDDRKTYYCALM